MNSRDARAALDSNRRGRWVANSYEQGTIESHWRNASGTLLEAPVRPQNQIAVRTACSPEQALRRAHRLDEL